MSTHWDHIREERRATGMKHWRKNIVPLSVFRCLKCGVIPDSALLERLKTASILFENHELRENCEVCGLDQTRLLRQGTEIVDDIKELKGY